MAIDVDGVDEHVKYVFGIEHVHSPVGPPGHDPLPRPTDWQLC
jgi:hypothetical protein